ncbi:hypothetical protein V8D89_016333 [Ganoderma adspersum]
MAPPPDDNAPWAALPFERDRLRSEIRTRMDRMLVELTGIANAHVHWTEEGYLNVLVFDYHCGIENWPGRWPFQNLSWLKGGCEPLREIRDSLLAGKLRIVRLTDEQLAEARANPKSFLPNPTLRSESRKSLRPETYHVVPLVLHPHDLSPISHPPTTSSVISPLIRIATGPESTPRRQRRDIKKRRRRPVTNPDDRPPRRRRIGVQTPEYVYDRVPDRVPDPSERGEEDEYETCGMPSGSAPSDDYVECFTEPGTPSEPESEIESATESWACGSQSEIEEFTDDEEWSAV